RSPDSLRARFPPAPPSLWNLCGTSPRSRRGDALGGGPGDGGLLANVGVQPLGELSRFATVGTERADAVTGILSARSRILGFSWAARCPLTEISGGCDNG